MNKFDLDLEAILVKGKFCDIFNITSNKQILEFSEFYSITMADNPSVEDSYLFNLEKKTFLR